HNELIWRRIRLPNPTLFRLHFPATFAMLDDTTAAFSFPAVERKKVTAAFDDGRLTSDGGVFG
ncbi:MAG: hypothetical protein WAK66_00665, partial [Methylocystis sp.]